MVVPQSYMQIWTPWVSSTPRCASRARTFQRTGVKAITEAHAARAVMAVRHGGRCGPAPEAGCHRATEREGEKKPSADEPNAPLSYRALVTLDTAYLERNGVRHTLSPGMQVTAEINLGNRTVLEYLLSPVQKVVHEAGRER
jgi:multidrug efflux pump subunit AcrA (membrane-fusion protein)